MMNDHDLPDLVRDAAIRATTAVGLAGVGVIHLVDGIDKYHETRYMFWMYMALIAGCVATAAAVLLSRSRTALLAAAGLAGSAFAGYVLSRSTGLPNATEDIGNWTEPLGLASLFVEGAVVLLAGAHGLRLTTARRSSSAPHTTGAMASRTRTSVTGSAAV